MVLDTDLQDEMQEQVRRIENADRVKPSVNEVETWIVNNLHGRASAREFTFDYDEPEYVVGGGNSAPRPLEYFLAGFAFCEQVQYARNALLNGIEIDDLRMEVEGAVRPNSHSGPRGQSGFMDDSLSVTTHIESDADPGEIRDLVQLAEDQCHAHIAFQRAMTVDRDVVLNGEPFDV